MHILREILTDFFVYFKPTSIGGAVRFAVLISVLGGSALWITHDPAVTDTTPADDRHAVRVQPVISFSNGASLSLIGSVAAINEATLQTEVSGRVTSVRVKLGDRVGQGQVIATLDNASQYAALIQAEGSYEAAQAAGAQSDVGVTQAETTLETAENAAVNTFRSAYTTASNVVYNNVDVFFTNPNAQSTPGLRIDGYGYTNNLNQERISFQSMFAAWRQELNTLDANDDLRGALRDARVRTERVLDVVDTFIVLLNDQEAPYGAYTQSELLAYSTTFVSLRAELNATLLAIENARTTLQSAEEGLARAEIGGTSGTVSASSANIKQALGALRNAQANYAKTILRSPISGEVQNISVQTGDVVTGFAPVATITNQNALEITTYVRVDQRERIAIGDTVTIEGEIPGTVTAIAPGVDQATGKIEVKIQSQSDTLANGDTVSVSITADENTDSLASGPIIIPISALKVETDRMVVFTISDEGTLIAHEITEGPLMGNSIIITEGITRDMNIVIDARGLNEGDAVTVLQ